MGLHWRKSSFGWCKRLFGDLCFLGPKDLLYPSLTTFGGSFPFLAISQVCGLPAPGLIQHMLTVLGFRFRVLLMPGSRALSMILRVCRWTSICFVAPSSKFLDLLPPAPLPSVPKRDARHKLLQRKGGTHRDKNTMIDKSAAYVIRKEHAHAIVVVSWNLYMISRQKSVKWNIAWPGKFRMLFFVM